jgi:ribonuclease HI
MFALVGQGVGCVIVSPGRVCTQLSIRLEFPCTNNQVEYEALLCNLQWVKGAAIRDISALGGSRLIVQLMGS